MRHLKEVELTGSEDSRIPRKSSSCSDPIERLVSECMAGDRASMQEIYGLCSGRIYALMVRMVGRQDADDLTQQVFLQMFRKLGQFSGKAKLETWLYRLATNEALQHLRRRKRFATEHSAAEHPKREPTAEEDTELGEVLERAMAQLEPELRAIFLLREQNELSYQEIAESLDIPEGTVGSRLNRARSELRRHMRTLGWGD